MKRTISNHKAEIPFVHANQLSHTQHLKQLGYIENSKPKLLKTKQDDKDELDWLQQIVHQFEVYKDLKDSSLFKDRQQTVEKSYSVEGLLQKVGLNENLYRNSQRKHPQQNRKPILSRPKQIKHQVILKNLPKNNTVPSNTKTKRSQSEGSGFAKKKDPPRNIKQKAKFTQTHKEMTETLKKNYELVEFCGIRDIKDDLVKMKNKLSMPESRHNLNKTNKAVVIKENRKNLLQSVLDHKSVGRIVKNKSIELKQRKVTTQNEENVFQEKINQNEIQNFLGRSREKVFNKIQTNRERSEDPVNLYDFKKFETSRQMMGKAPLQEQCLNVGLLIADTDKNKVKQEARNHEGQKEQENKSAKQNTKGLKITQNKKFNYLSQKCLESRYEKICQKKQRKLNTSFGDRKIQQLATISDENSLKRLQPVVEVIEHQISQELDEPQSVKNHQEKAPADPKWLINQNLSKLYGNVKLVESTKNSQVFTQHSIVIDKNLLCSQVESGKESCNEDWNITQIFDKLDRKRLGFLNRDNCSVQNIGREIRIILRVVLDEIIYKNIQYTFVEFINRVQTTLDSIKDIGSLSQPATHLAQQRFAPISQNSDQIRFNSTAGCKENSAINKVNTNKQDHKKYEYTKVFISDVETEPSHKKQVNNSQVIRFATFQDEQINAESEQPNFEIKDVKDTQKITNGNKERMYIKTRDIQKLEIKLQGLTEFKSKYDPQSKHLAGLNEKYPSINRIDTSNSYRKLETQGNIAPEVEIKARQRSYSEAGKKDYKNEIVKLEMLNQRLQKYLHAQNMKQFSASKLLI